MASGIGIGLLVALLAGLGPARRAAAIPPAEAVRPSAPPVGRGLTLFRHVGAGLPVPVRMGLRNLVRHPGRAAATAAGVAASLMLVLTTSALVDSMDRGIDLQFQEAMRYDLRADLLLPRPAEDLGGRVAGIPGAAVMETVLSLPVRLSAGGRHQDSLLHGVPRGASLLRSVDFDGVERMPRAGGVVIGRPVATKLGLAVGDPVDVSLLPSGTPRRLRVDAVSDTTLGGFTVMGLEDARGAFGLGGLSNTVLVGLASPGDREAVRAALQELPGVLRLHDVASVRAELGRMMGLAYAMVGAMLAFSVVLAAAILFNTATLAILERQRELATMRAIGRPMGSIAAMITFENGLLGLLGLVAGLPLSVWAIREALALYSSDLFSLPFVLTARTFGIAALGVVLVLLVAEWPGLRQVARMNLAEVVRSREG